MKKRREKVGEKARRMAPKIREGLVMLLLSRWDEVEVLLQFKGLSVCQNSEEKN